MSLVSAILCARCLLLAGRCLKDVYRCRSNIRGPVLRDTVLKIVVTLKSIILVTKSGVVFGSSAPVSGSCMSGKPTILWLQDPVARVLMQLENVTRASGWHF